MMSFCTLRGYGIRSGVPAAETHQWRDGVCSRFLFDGSTDHATASLYRGSGRDSFSGLTPKRRFPGSER
jgi:hypothetical protein